MTAGAMKHDVKTLVRQFRIPGDFASAAPYGSGHINDTYAVVFNQAGTPVRYIVQRINHNVFKNPVAVMQNIERVCSHLQKKLDASGAKDTSRRALSLVPSLGGKSWFVDAGGNHWRVYLFVEKVSCYDQIENPRQAFEAARAYGEFQKQLSDLPAPRLVDTIPNFHHTRSRYNAFQEAWKADVKNRAAAAKKEIDFALSREAISDVLLKAQAEGIIPERVTHNDTKLNNVMLDDATMEGVCVIDLDTVMPGLTLYDFGDMCRTATRPTPEDERDLSKVEMQMGMFEALVQGYLSSAGSFLNKAEVDHLVFSARLITYEIGLRFLTDFLQGDMYFKTHRDGHNLDRCRVQFKMVESFERNEAAMQKLVAQSLK